MKIYRIENEATNHGMWYRLDGTYDPFIKTLTEGISKDLPMGYNERYSKDGLKWFSGCGNIEDMKHWFSALDALELHQNGYKLFEFEATQFSVVEYEVMFTKESVVSKKEIPLETIWDMTQFK